MKMDGNHLNIKYHSERKGGFEEVASYFEKIATTCTETVSFESCLLRNLTKYIECVFMLVDLK